jgi:DNA-binding IclR family transcriptional regulator
MSELITPAARATKIVSAVLKATQRESKQAAIAAATGMPESTLSRLLSDHLEKLALVMAHAGLRVVSEDARCFSPKDIDALLTMAQRHMNSLQGVSSLEWED